jgi:hypothetical protein
MFQCEGKCRDWFHPGCMGISTKERNAIVENNQKWICKYCQEDM